MLLAGDVQNVYLGASGRLDVPERLLGQVVVLAVADLLEVADRVGELREITGEAGEGHGDASGQLTRSDTRHPSRES